MSSPEEQPLVRSLRRGKLAPLDEARAFRRLLELDPGVTQKDLAVRIGRSQATISKRLGLLGGFPRAPRESGGQVGSQIQSENEGCSLSCRLCGRRIEFCSQCGAATEHKLAACNPCAEMMGRRPGTV